MRFRLQFPSRPMALKEEKKNMKTVNLNTQERIKFTLYPDNQPHINITDVAANDEVRVVAPIRSSLELIQLLEVSNALDHLFAHKRDLVIPYLMAARFDRLMQHGDSVDLEVVAQLINSCAFPRVNLFDVHSDVALRLIRNSHSHNNSKLLKAYTKTNAVLICPDGGAAKKIEDYKKHLHLSDVVYCIKGRDLSNGKVSLKVIEPQRCEGKNCVIVDDICDGGATFIAISDQINPAHLTLIVSHGIFSKGFSVLEQHFDEIITSDSYRNHGDSKFVNTIPLNL